MKKKTEKIWKWILAIVAILVVGYAIFELLIKIGALG